LSFKGRSIAQITNNFDAANWLSPDDFRTTGLSDIQASGLSRGNPFFDSLRICSRQLSTMLWCLFFVSKGIIEKNKRVVKVGNALDKTLTNSEQ
jgi:hypothetical protein